MLARCPQFEEALTVCTIDPREVAAARLRDTRHRANVRRQRRAAPRRRPAGRPRRPASRSRRRRDRGRRDGRAARPRGRGLRGAAHRPARLRGEERLRARGAGALGRDRLGAGGADRRRRARRRSASPASSMPSPYSSEGTQADARDDRGEPRRRLHRARRSTTRWRPTTRCSRGLRRDASPTSPRRTSRRASAATCVMALSNKFGWLVLDHRQQVARCRWATRRSTATWRAASPC